jgi:hypothetical protein
MTASLDLFCFESAKDGQSRHNFAIDDPKADRHRGSAAPHLLIHSQSEF